MRERDSYLYATRRGPKDGAFSPSARLLAFPRPPKKSFCPECQLTEIRRN
jgi:hypothetical protein